MNPRGGQIYRALIMSTSHMNTSRRPARRRRSRRDVAALFLVSSVGQGNGLDCDFYVLDR